jgi:hypothetical protein
MTDRLKLVVLAALAGLAAALDHVLAGGGPLW